MRWLFLLLLSINLAYIAWELGRPPSEKHAEVAALKNVQPIVLLSEIKQQAVLDSETVEPEPVSKAAPANAGVSSVEEVSSGSASSKEAEAEETVPAKDVAIEKLSDPVTEAAPAEQIKEKPDVTKRPAPAAVVAKKVESKKAQPVVAVKTAPAPVKQASCYTLGPFRDLDKLRSLTREIKSYVEKADFRGREEKEQTLYWVYIKPEKTRNKAIETGNRLKARKIKDFYVIRTGEKVNGLSLGHFRNKDGAYGLAKKVKNLGFDVTVEPVFKTYTVYWLDYQLSSGVVIPESIFNKYSKAAKKDKISRLSRDCGV